MKLPTIQAVLKRRLFLLFLLLSRRHPHAPLP